jgi:iron-sulfur cluster assembly accessory protein
MTDLLKTPTSPGSAGITISPAALTKAKELRDSQAEPGLFLRIEVKPGGCSGFSYDLCFDNEKLPDDVVTDHDGFEVVVDQDSAALLQGATLEYQDTLNKTGFSIENPNASRTCGCGKSFC